MKPTGMKLVLIKKLLRLTIFLRNLNLRFVGPVKTAWYHIMGVSLIQYYIYSLVAQSKKFIGDFR